MYGTADQELGIAQILTDQYNMNILAATSYKARSARELAFMFDIPLASCYRKLRELSAANLVEQDGSELTADGKRYKVYRSRIGSVTLIYEKGMLHLKLDLNHRSAPVEISQNMATPKPREIL
ncbi:MAG: helix-turn-helix transcriptional regulator [Methanobacteriota archaeon]|nr:MAG: helix-turn-helix transcriptional regulator [Euryarchaeota archaeon]